ncbi:hypothetical protein [Thermoflavimicrobium daqui]|jgi:hypothetical protein|uniref:BioF2-like acetyltransferase domain-containing protein n=1 Tax=Thermoflavimicrobium daqui TaxID=2137476 RepID=A0A364K0J3_9BACL|nr:hypothetical protein [Thermoflavimicrobium daqui]RAL21027.1 hypothetical protein DL897_17495 [Thermoflavimicrobium daqui]
MQLVEWQTAFLKVLDVYGWDQKSFPIPKVDLIIYSQLPEILLRNQKYTLHKRFRTLYIDLQKDEESLFADLSKTTRYQIKRAIREQFQVVIETSPSQELVYEFCNSYNLFANKKGIPASNMSKLQSLNQKGLLVISYALDPNNEKVCFHASNVRDQRACMIYSCSNRFSLDSSQRNAIGRANRYLHWMEILHFKEAGYTIYDFCGLSLDKGNQKLQKIDHFKKKFGGKEVIEYKCYEAKTWIGKLALLYLSWKWKDSPELIEVNF